MDLEIGIEEGRFAAYLLPRSAEVLSIPGLLPVLRVAVTPMDRAWDLLDAALHRFDPKWAKSIVAFYENRGPSLLELVADADELDRIDRGLERELRALAARLGRSGDAAARLASG